MKKVLALSLVMFMLLSAFVVSASADADYNDKQFTILLDCTSPNTYQLSTKNGTRPKGTDSAVYVYPQVGPGGGGKYRIYGTNDGSITTLALATNCTVLDAIIYPGQQRRVRQYVNENGFSHAVLTGCYYYGNTGAATGVWSPDCAGNYPYAN